jgi:hypothetical protein
MPNSFKSSPFEWIWCYLFQGYYGADLITWLECLKESDDSSIYLKLSIILKFMTFVGFLLDNLWARNQKKPFARRVVGQFHVDFSLKSEMILNYQVIVERYPFMNGVVGGSIPFMKSFLYFMEKKKLGK